MHQRISKKAGISNIGVKNGISEKMRNFSFFLGFVTEKSGIFEQKNKNLRNRKQRESKLYRFYAILRGYLRGKIRVNPGVKYASVFALILTDKSNLFPLFFKISRDMAY